ncbi:DUF4355 domain-containing protein [Clostridium botulinum C/D]|nr:DUF4355 domain-containing protein [Clostridium botulinum C/D]
MSLQLFADPENPADPTLDNPGEPEKEGESFSKDQVDLLVGQAVTEALAAFKKESDQAAKLAKLGKEEREKAQFEIDKENFEKERANYEKEKLELQVVKELSKKNIDAEFAGFVLGSNADECITNITKLENLLKAYGEKAIAANEKFRDMTPKIGNSSVASSNNPYAKESFNLTRQMELEIMNPTLAKQLREQVNN